MKRPADANTKKIDDRNNAIRKVIDWSMRHFFITFILLYALSTISIILKNSGASIIFAVMLLIYTITYLSSNIKKNIEKFLHHELELRQIIVGYLTSVLSLMMLFAIVYWGSTALGFGYIKYGGCEHIAKITPEIIANDPSAIRHMADYAYFSAVTFFTVGYGDICPMGITKLISILNAMIGNMFTVVILSIAITNYTSKEDKK